MSAKDDWKGIQRLLGTSVDGIPGRNDEAAITRLKEAALAEHRESKQAGTGLNRTDWRGYREVNETVLKGALPDRAQFLAPYFLQNAKKYDLNPLFLVAISKHETGNWTSNVFKTKANAMGISNATSAISQESYNASIRTAAYSLSRPGGFYSKARTLADVGAIYAPVGAANDPGKLNGHWSGQVSKYWSELENAVA